MLQNKPCIVTVIIFVVIPLLTGNVLFDVQGVQAERVASVLTVFHTNPVNPQATTTGVHMPYNWSPTTATTTGVHMPSGYGTANTDNKGVSSTTITHNTASVFGTFFQTAGKTNNAYVLSANNKGVSSTTITHNTANNDAVFGTFFQTATTSARHADPVSTSTADPTSTSTADPTSTTTLTIADPVVSHGAQKIAGVVIEGTGGSLARTIRVDLSAQAATIADPVGDPATPSHGAQKAPGDPTILETLLVIGIAVLIIALSIRFYASSASVSNILTDGMLTLP